MQNWDELLATLRAGRIPELILAAVELEIFTRLNRQALGVDEVAAAVGADSRATQRLLDGLAAIGLVQKKRRRYANTPLSGKYLNRHSPEHKLNALGLIASGRRSWQKLADVVRRGGPEAGDIGAFRHDAQINRTFIGAMHDIGYGNARALAAGIDFSPYKRLLDVGGGPGSYAIAMLERYPEMRATLIDLPLTLQVAKEYIAKHRLDGRIRLQAVDLFADATFDLDGPFDLVLVSNVLHMTSAADAATLIAKLAGHLAAGGMLVVHEAFIGEARIEPVETALFAIDMLLATAAGNCYTYDEVGAWMRAAGLVDVHAVEGIFERPSLLLGHQPGKAHRKQPPKA